jgi:hypothetical protein
VASVIPDKGLHVLVDALSAVRDLDWRATIVGDDTLDPAFASGVRRHIEASPVAERIEAVGPVIGEAMQAAYDRADLFVLPSAFETCSMATREAMARGLPVVASRVGGVPENFGGVRAGRLVPAGDAEAFASALRSLLRAPSLRRQMGDAARARSHCFPSWDETAGRFYRVLAGTVA